MRIWESGRLAVPEKIVILESRASRGSAASLASGADALGVHAAPRRSLPPIRFPSSTTRSCSLLSTHLGKRNREAAAVRDAEAEMRGGAERRREDTTAAWG
uniref:AW257883 n=1 Tax=Arundo donax TaxID=35708 RepID=A0A0A9DUZ9_ARUDO